MSKDLNRLLNLHNKGVTEARDPLARLYRQILWDVGMTMTDLNNLMTRWLDNPRNKIDMDGKSRSTERGNIIQELTRANMTLKVFVKRLRLLPIVRIRLIVEAEWENKNITTHSVVVQLNEEIDDGEATPDQHSG